MLFNKWLTIITLFVLLNWQHVYTQCIELTDTGYIYNKKSWCDTTETVYDSSNNTYHIFIIYDDTINKESIYYTNGTRLAQYQYKSNKRHTYHNNDYLYDRDGVRRGSNVYKYGILRAVNRNSPNNKCYYGRIYAMNKPIDERCKDTIDGLIIIRYISDNDSLFFWVKDYPNTGTTQFEGGFMNGKPHGNFRTYHKNGLIRSEIMFENGFLKSIKGLYSINGDTIAITPKDICSNKNKQFVYLEFEDGLLFSKKIYQKMGYIDDYKDGVYNLYYNGNNNNIIRSTFHYVKGVKEGEYTEFYMNGSVACIGKFKRGVATGVWKYYNQIGDLVFVTDFDTGYP